MPHSTIGRFEIQETLGAGATSTVYRALDGATGAKVTIKLLHPHRSFGEMKARFEKEARVLSSLHHRNVVQIREFGESAEGQPFMVFENVEAVSLSEFLGREREMFPDVAAMMVLEIARGVAAAHGRGVIHRDLKPENVLVTKEGLLKISDFGLAHFWEGSDVTLPGTRIGSPPYMSPGQIRGEKASPAMDLFSLGALFYLLLTGELPYKGKSRKETFAQILGGPPVPPRRVQRHVAEELSSICMRLLDRKDPAALGSAEDLVTALHRYLSSLGLHTYEEPLKAYLASPKAGREGLRTWLLEAYLRAGRAAVEGKDREQSFELFQTVLCLAGEVSTPSFFSDEVLPTKKVRLFQALRAWLWVALAAATALAAAGVVWLYKG